MIVLDTHALVWWASADSHLSDNARTMIDAELAHEDGLLIVCTISVWEIAMLVQSGRLTLSMSVDDWIDTASRIDGLHIAPLDSRIAIESTRLPGDFHKDPADRMIVALARQLNAVLITADHKIRSYQHVTTMW